MLGRPRLDSNKRNFYLVLGLFLLAVLIRTWNLSSQSYSNDEVIELEDARDSLSAMIVAPDSFPPLFRLMLAAVLRITDAAIAGRWMSVFFGALCVPLAYGCGQLVGSHRVGLLTALLVAFSPICVYYAQEVRPYALYMLAAAALLYTGLAAIKEDKSTYWVWFAIAAILACYVHYYSALMVIAIFSAWLLDRMSTKSFRRGLLALLGIVLGCLPVLFLLATDFASPKIMPRLRWMLICSRWAIHFSAFLPDSPSVPASALCTSSPRAPLQRCERSCRQF